MKIYKTTFVLIGSLIFLTFLVGCKETQPVVYNHSSALIILGNADDVFYDFRDGGRTQLSYKIKENYPAKKSINQITSQLENNGWLPLKIDYLNPDIPSSLEKGWGNYENAAHSPITIVHQWMNDWKDKYGNIVRYIFIYEYPKDTKENLSVLQIHELYMPEALVSLAENELELFEKMDEQ